MSYQKKDSDLLLSIFKGLYYVVMDLKTTAEFRFIDLTKVPQLIEAAEITKKVKKSFLGLKSKEVFEDNFESYLEKNTQLFHKLEGEGFLYFSDLYNFFKWKKDIYLLNDFHKRFNQKAFANREEWALFIPYDHVYELGLKLDDFDDDDEALQAFNRSIGMEGLEELIPFQKQQIKQFLLALNKLVPNQVLYVRSELMPKG